MSNPWPVIAQTPRSDDGIPHGDRDSGKVAFARVRALERIKPLLRPAVHVIMEGESGVGKAFHARLLHEQTPARGEGAFVEITSQTAEEILRAILFDDDRRLVEQKAGNALPSLEGHSTLFLPNIDELSILHQRVLSRFLIQQKSDQRTPYRQTRIIASTTHPWSELMRKRMLVDSLAHTMQQFDVCTILPLRERRDELFSLVHTILADVRLRTKVDCTCVNDDAFEQLGKRSWRDNIRELKYVIEDAAFRSVDGTLRLDDRSSDEIDLVWEMFRTIQSGKQLTIDQSLAAIERAMIERALIRHNFDQRKTARILAMTEPNLTYRIKKFNIYIPASK